MANCESQWCFTFNHISIEYLSEVQLSHRHLPLCYRFGPSIHQLLATDAEQEPQASMGQRDPVRTARPAGQSVPHSAQVQSRASQGLLRRSIDS